MTCSSFTGDALVAVIGGDIVWESADPRIHATNELADLPDFTDVYRVVGPCPERDEACHAVRLERPLPT